MAAFDQDRTRQFYDRFGARQDSQGFYEDAALVALVRAGHFDAAESVLEVGCGTGKLAARLLADHLSSSARYVGIDISSTMVALARERLSPWADRAQVHLSAGDFDFRRYGGAFDRVVFTYVFDLLSAAQIRAALAGAHAGLHGGGLLCSAGLTVGDGLLSRATSTLWALVHRATPYLVGGCRPLVLVDFLSGDDWRVVHREVIVSALVPSEIITAEAI